MTGAATEYGLVIDDEATVATDGILLPSKPWEATLVGTIARFAGTFLENALTVVLDRPIFGLAKAAFEANAYG